MASEAAVCPKRSNGWSAESGSKGDEEISLDDQIVSTLAGAPLHAQRIASTECIRCHGRVARARPILSGLCAQPDTGRLLVCKMLGQGAGSEINQRAAGCGPA